MLLLQGRISSPQNMTLCVIGRARFERNCGKMYSRHLFPYGGFTKLDQSLQRLGLQLFVNAKNGNIKRRYTNCLQDVHFNLY